MKILHLSNDFYPNKIGGTEIFIFELLKPQYQSYNKSNVLWASYNSNSNISKELININHFIFLN